MVDLAFALRVLRALDGKGQAAIRAEFPAGVLLPGGEGTSKAGGFSAGRIAGHHALGHDDRPLKMEADRGLERQRIARMEPPACDRDEESRCQPKPKAGNLRLVFSATPGSL